MGKLEELEILDKLKGKIGCYSDNQIIVSCNMFSFKKIPNNRDILSAEITIRTRRIPKEQETMEALKNILEKSNTAMNIGKLIIFEIEKERSKETKNLQVEMKKLLGIPEEKREQEKIGNDYNPEGGTIYYEINN